MHYGISDNELNTLGLYNVLVAAFFSAATLLGGLALSIWIEVGTQAETTTTGQVLEDWVAPILVVFAVFFALLAGIVWRVRASTVTTIKKQSRPHEVRER